MSALPTPRYQLPVSTAAIAVDAPLGSLADYPAARLFGLDLLCGARDDVARDIVDMASCGDFATIDFINAHCVNVACADGGYRKALSAADHLLPDGSGMAFAAALAGVRLGDNLNGTDLFPDLCRHAAAVGTSLFLLGARPGLAAAAAATMRARFPALRIAGTRHGFWEAEDETRLLNEINASGAGILLVGLGVPHQERFIARVRDRLTVPVVMGVGGLFDYYSGAIPRAPQALRRLGLEWTWRLMQEPSRLARRYLLGNPLFLGRAVSNAIAARRWAAKGERAGKRLFDLATAMAGLLVALPLLLLVSLLIKAEDGGPVFFRQTRIGEKGRPFAMWKFRSMAVDAERRLADLAARSERNGACFKMRRDPRVTRVGALIRKLSIDELPQLLNVVGGDMSIVGPRPALPREVLAYSPRDRGRLAGLPGLTCTWQVSGRADIPFREQVKLDVAYLASRTFLGDLWLVLRTVPAVLTGRGAY